MRALLTNDDGIEAEGLHELRRALLARGIDVMVIAPDGNRSATGRAITTRSAMVVRRVRFRDGGEGFAIEGTPVDCVRLGWYELAGAQPDLVVAGINHGANLGDDVTYSGTVGAALEAHHLGLPGLAVSQIARGAGLSFADTGGYDFAPVAAFAADLAARSGEVGLGQGTVLSVNAPAGELTGVEVTRLGKRRYTDALREIEGEAPALAARHGAAESTVEYGEATRVALYGTAADHAGDPGTDLSAVAAGRISVTPVTLRWTDEQQRTGLEGVDLGPSLEAARGEVDDDAAPAAAGGAGA